jgi:branched-chain amino acid transport system permease protein
MHVLVQSIVNGILMGGLYAIIGLGMSLIFGIMRLTNLAHGDLMIASTYLSMVLALQFSGNILFALGITLVVMSVVGFFIQNFLINRVIDKGMEPPLLVTFGLSIILQNVLLLVFGSGAKSIHTPLSTVNAVTTPWFSVSAVYLINFVVAVTVILVLHFLIRKTYLGRSIRSTSDDPIASELMGVNTKRTYAYTMCLAMVTAAVAGLLVGMTFINYPSTGTQYLIIAFGVVVIGGMGSLAGTLIGGIILGLSQMIGAYLFGPAYQLIAGYVMLLIILTFRPQGLLANAARS